MKTVLITGTSSGIGRATAEACADAGWNVIATTRRELDVTDPQSIADCMAKLGRLDALVNNAGVAGTNPTLELSEMADLRSNMEVNFFGVIAVSRAAIPLLRASRGRLLTISSVRGVIGQPFNEGYSAAKFAVEGFMEGLAPVAATVGVSVCLIEPAAVLDTEFVNNAPERSMPPGGPYEAAFRAYREWVQTGAIEGAQKSADIAAVVVDTLNAENPPFRVQTSAYGRTYVSRKLSDPSGSSIQAMTRSWVGAA